MVSFSILGRFGPRCSAQAKVSGYLHFSNEHRPEVTTRVNAMEGLAPRERVPEDHRRARQDVEGPVPTR